MKKIKPTKGARLCARYGYYQKRNYCYKKFETFFSYLIPRIAKRPSLPYAVHARRVIVRDNLDHPSFLHAVTATSVETRQGAVSRRTRGMNGPRLEKKKERKGEKGRERKNRRKGKEKKSRCRFSFGEFSGLRLGDATSFPKRDSRGRRRAVRREFYPTFHGTTSPAMRAGAQRR